MKKKSIIAGLLCGAFCVSVMTACANNGGNTESSQNSETKPAQTKVEQLHKLYIRAPKDLDGITATFMNTSNGNTADIEMEKSGEDDKSAVFCCEADVNLYGGIAAVVLICNDKIKSLIYNVSSVGYIKMKLNEVLSFEGRNTYSLYQYLCQNHFRGHWIADITELKSYMGIDEKYKLFQNFERRVLIPCKKEIEKKTSLRFNYKKIRSGRQIKKLSFQIVKKAVVEEHQETEFDDDTLPFAQDGDKVSLLIM